MSGSTRPSTTWTPPSPRSDGSIFELEDGSGHRGLRRGVLELAGELTAMLGSRPEVTFSGPVDSGVPQHIADHLLAVLREALTNAAKHARATHFTVNVSVGAHVTLEVADDGVGIESANGDGLGLTNLAQSSGPPRRHLRDSTGPGRRHQVAVERPGLILASGRHRAGRSSWTTRWCPIRSWTRSGTLRHGRPPAWRRSRPAPRPPGRLIPQHRARAASLCQQESGDTKVLEGIGHHERHFGPCRVVEPVIATHRDQLIGQLDHQRHPVPAVNGGQMLDFLWPQVEVGIEVPHGHAPGATAAHENAPAHWRRPG